MSSRVDRLSESCGDWLLLPDRVDPPAPSRSGPWEKTFEAGGRALWWAPPTAGWVGTPWRQLDASHEQCPAWLLGESPASDRELGELTRELGRSDLDPSATLGGRFLLLLYRPADQSWQLSIDRFATLHAYSTADGRVLGTSFQSVSAYSSKRLDWRGLSTFFALGFFTGDRTYFEDVRFLAPARRHRFDDRGVTSARYWQWWHRPESGRRPEETRDVFAEVFASVVSESCRGRVALPLSGGLDSRALVAALPRNAHVRTFSYGYRADSVEIRLSRRLARRRALPFSASMVKPYLTSRLDLALDTVEGFQDITQSRQLSVADTLGEHGDFVLAGHWGDVWLNDMGLPGVTANQLPGKLYRKMAKNGRSWLLEHLCEPHLEGQPSEELKDPEALVLEELTAALAEYDHLEEIDFKVKAFKTDHWSSRWTLTSVRAYQAAAFPRLPFYDPRLTDFFATVETSQLTDRRLEIDYLLHHSPDLARIPWQETGAALGTSRRRAWWQGLPRRAAAKAWRGIRRRPVIERNWEVQWLAPEGRTLLEDLLLRRGLRIHDLVAPEAVGRLIDDFYARPTAGSGYTVSMLATVAAWIERS